MKRVLVVCKCVGGTESLKPVAELLKNDYHLEWVEHDRVGDIGPKPDMILTSTCSGVGREAARHFRHVPLIAMQNQWTAGLNEWADETFKPNYVLVNDLLDYQQTLDAWKGYDPHKIVITGYPAMDKYADFDIEAAKRKVEQNLGIDVSGRIPVVLFAGQWWLTGHAIMETVAALNEIGKFIHFIPRAHPRMKDNSPEEVPAWEKSLLDFNCGNIIINSSSCGISDLVAASDVVVSMFSTVLQEAAILRKQNIALLYPKTGGRVYETETGIPVSQYPMVDLNCSALATNRDELLVHLLNSLDNKLGLRTNQRETFQLDGLNAQRAADFIRSVCKSS